MFAKCFLSPSLATVIAQSSKVKEGEKEREGGRECAAFVCVRRRQQLVRAAKILILPNTAFDFARLMDFLFFNNIYLYIYCLSQQSIEETALQAAGSRPRINKA